MATITIDCYGNKDIDFGKFLTKAGEKQPVVVDDADTVTYMCFKRADAGEQAIQKVLKAGTITTMMWGFGDWSDRTNIQYTATLNEPLTVTVG